MEPCQVHCYNITPVIVTNGHHSVGKTRKVPQRCAGVFPAACCCLCFLYTKQYSSFSSVRTCKIKDGGKKSVVHLSFIF